MACKMQVAGSLGDYHASIPLIFGYAFLDDFKGAVGGAIVRKYVLQFTFIILGECTFYGGTDVLLPVVREKYVR